jgi:hypothetical protein
LATIFSNADCIFVYFLLNQYIVVLIYLSIYPSKHTVQCLVIMDYDNVQKPVPFNQCTSSFADLRTRLLCSSQLMFAALPYIRLCTQWWIYLHQSGYLAQILHRAGYPGQMHQQSEIHHCEEMLVNTHIRPSTSQFGNILCHVHYPLRTRCIAARGGLGSIVDGQCQSGEDRPFRLHCQHVCEYFAQPLWCQSTRLFGIDKP